MKKWEEVGNFGPSRLLQDFPWVFFYQRGSMVLLGHTGQRFVNKKDQQTPNPFARFPFQTLHEDFGLPANPLRIFLTIVLISACYASERKMDG